VIQHQLAEKEKLDDELLKWLDEVLPIQQLHEDNE